MKFWLPVGLVFILFFSLTYLFVKGETVPDEKALRPKIGFSIDSLVVDRWQRDRDTFIARANDLGMDVLFQNANEDPLEQVRQIEYLMNQGISVLVVIPNDASSLVPILRVVKSRGIKIVTYDRYVPSLAVDLHFMFDNVMIGRLIAHEGIEGIESPRILIINGSTSDDNSFLYQEGFHLVLDPLVEEKKAEIVREVMLEAWSADQATAAIRLALDDGLKPNVVLAGNDQLAEAIIQVLAERGLLAGIRVMGHDAELSACQRIVEGTQWGTIYKPIEEMALLAAEGCAALAFNKTDFSTQLTLMRDGQTIPARILEPVSVTKKNIMKVIIGTGFHRYEDVYRNL